MNSAVRVRFRELHLSGTFVIPNPWDIGSARMFEDLGFTALATTSSGLARSLGKRDQEVTLDELSRHVEQLVDAVTVPVHVDAERCFADDPDGVALTVERLAQLGASGISIEDFAPAAGAIDPLGVAADRVRAAAEVAHAHGMLLTARAENHLYGAGDLDDTIARVPVNVLLWPGGPTIAELRSVGVRRISTGGALADAAYDAARHAALSLQAQTAPS